MRHLTNNPAAAIHRSLIANVFMVLLCVPHLSAANDLASQAFTILETKCGLCHSKGNFKVDGLDVLNFPNLVDPNAKTQYITPADPDESLLWQEIENESMPPSGQPPLTDSEKAIIKQWILKGAPQRASSSRTWISEETILKLIEQDLNKLSDEDRSYTKYFSLHNVWNDSQVSDEELAVYRAGFSKLVNSLSNNTSIVVPTAIDANQNLFRIDLRHYGWDDLEICLAISNEYPYGLRPGANMSLEMLQRFDRIVKLFEDSPRASLTGLGRPYYRADWFAFTASRPEFYHLIARIPETIDGLLANQGVDYASDFSNGNLRRGAVVESGVSSQNRVLDFIPTRHGGLWLSHDFNTSTIRGNLHRFPLGPETLGSNFQIESRYQGQAFRQAGGEIIYALRNGLQGYMLIDDKGNRIDRGPPEIVHDLAQAAGTSEIFNGISCMNCHSLGIQPFREVLRADNAVKGTGNHQMMHRLYAEQQEIDQIVQESNKRYRAALSQSVAPFVAIEKATAEEPIGALVRYYQQDIDFDRAVSELGFPPGTTSKEIFKTTQMRTLALSGLSHPGGRIKRSYWHSKEENGIVSVFHNAAQEIGQGNQR